MRVELAEKSILWPRQRDAQLRSCIGLYLVQELRHLLGVHPLRLTNHLLHALTDMHHAAEKLLAVVVVNVLRWCSRLTLDAAEPHPHEGVLRYRPLLRHFLDLDAVRAILQQREDVGRLLVKGEPPTLFLHDDCMRHNQNGKSSLCSLSSGGNGVGVCDWGGIAACCTAGCCT